LLFCQVVKKTNVTKQWKIGVAGAVVHQGRVLLACHTYGEKDARWALPGGYARQDERLDQAMLRELWEETRLRAQVSDIIGLVTRYTAKDAAVFVVFRLRLLSGQAQADGVEVDRLGWFSASQVAAMTDEELWYDIRRPTLAALRGGEGLLDDGRYPSRSEKARGFLIRWEKL
jgi:ADP-ribose pyrophosphatase YjhB (NUDIX family)